MSTKNNDAIDDLIFRDGRWITAGAIVGSLLIVAGCFGGCFTAFEIDESTWESKVWFRFGFVFLFFFAGFFAIAASILRPWRMLLISGLISAAVALVIAFFPSGAQLVAGPDVYVGTIQKIVVPPEQMRDRVKPMSKTMSAGLVQLKAIVTLKLASGEQKVLKLNCRDLSDHFGVEVHSLSPPKSGTWRLVCLPYLDRILTLRPQ